MVIQCNACQTRFRLADDKIKPQGTRVRCSKCGEVFTIMPPAPVAEEFAPPAPSTPPPAATDTAAAGEDQAMAWSRFEAAGDDSAPPAPAADETFNPFPEEPAGGAAASDEFRFVDSDSPAATDEEFAFEPSGAAPRPDELHFIGAESPAAADDEFAFEPSAAASSTDEFHFAGSESPAATDEEFAFDASPTDEFAFDEEASGDEDEFAFEEGSAGGEKDFVFDTEEPGGAAGESLPPLEFDTLSFEGGPRETGSPDEDFDAGLGAGVSDELVFEESDDSSFAFSAETGAEDFPWGEPDETTAAPGDFEFGTTPDQEEGPGADTPDFSSPAPAGETAVQAAAPAVAPAASKAAVPREPLPLPPVPKVSPARRKHARRKGKKTSFLTWLTILILLGLCAATGYFYWIGEFPDVNSLLQRFMPPATTTSAVSRIKVTELNGFFVNNTEAGQLFVVRGVATNGYSEPRSAMAVKGQIFNRDGGLLRERVAYCGNALSENELRSLPLAKLRERSDNQFGDSLSNLNVAPGKSVPFVIVFSNLPPNLAEFSVEPGDSIPGSKQ
jgi:predicted Zn finger-like uncharacterized protein